MQEDKNYYEILGIKSTANFEEIKRAYFTCVRKYPPERSPEEFKKVREAYDVLSNAETRKEYDSSTTNKPFSDWMEKVYAAMDSENHTLALQLVDKALETLADNSLALNAKGMCLMNLDRFDEAISFYKKLIAKQPDIAFYYYNIGVVYIKKNYIKQAIQSFNQAIEINKNEPLYYSKLSFCYYAQKEYDKAKDILTIAIGMDPTNPGLYSNLLMIDAETENYDELLKHVSCLEKMLKSLPEEKEYVAWLICNTTSMVIGKRPEIAEKLLAKAKKINPNEQAIKELIKSAKVVSKFNEWIVKMNDDQSIHPWLKDIVRGTTVGFENEQESLELSICERLILRSPQNVIDSVRHIEKNYPVLFKECKKLFSKILDNPNGSVVNESELLRDIKFMEQLKGELPNVYQLSLDDVIIPPMTRIRPSSAGRNDPCPCGSGKKYKKCCG